MRRYVHVHAQMLIDPQVHASIIGKAQVLVDPEDSQVHASILGKYAYKICRYAHFHIFKNLVCDWIYIYIYILMRHEASSCTWCVQVHSRCVSAFLICFLGIHLLYCEVSNAWIYVCTSKSVRDTCILQHLMRSYIFTYIHTYTHTYTHVTYILQYLMRHAYTHTYIHIHIHTYMSPISCSTWCVMHMHIYTYTYTYIHTCHLYPAVLDAS